MTETKRRGRKPNFPDAETRAFGATIPVDTHEMIRQMATDREEPINVLVDRLVRSEFNRFEKNRARRKTKAKAKTQDTEQANA